MIKDFMNGWVEETPKQWRYAPQEDITPYELALILPIFHYYATSRFYTKKCQEFENWDLVKRHFVHE